MQDERRTVTWSEFACQAPELAEFGLALFQEHQLAYLATVRRNGSPRLHPVTPVQEGDGLFVAVNERSPKRWDLQRDGRYALHAPLGEDDGEFVITGLVRRVRDADTQQAIAQAATHVIHESDWLFEFLIQRCHQGYWVNAGQPGTYPVYRRWPEG